MGVSVVTGANRGIGLELCRELKRRGREVVAGCRERSKELAELSIRIVDHVDVTEAAGIATLSKELANDSIDLLVNNAGILRADSLEGVETDSIRTQLEVNALAPLLVTKALLPRMKSGAKLALITSRMGSIADNSSGGYYGYRMSKAALNAAGMSLAHDLRSRGIAVLILHPGFVRTQMTAGHGAIAPAESARGLVDRIDELTLENSGRFLHMNGEALPW